MWTDHNERAGLLDLISPLETATQPIESPLVFPQPIIEPSSSPPAPSADREPAIVHSPTSSNSSTPNSSPSGSGHDSPAPSLPDTVEPPFPPPEPLGRSHRKKTRTATLQGYVTNTVQAQPLPSSSEYPITNFINSKNFSTQHRAYQVAIMSATEPKSYNQAIRDEVWRDAMGNEFKAHKINGTWSVTDLPPGKKALGNMWVYKLNSRADGTLERHKARLVVLGNRQIEGIDYGETFAPVAKMDTIRLFLLLLVDIMRSIKWTYTTPSSMVISRKKCI